MEHQSSDGLNPWSITRPRQRSSRRRRRRSSLPFALAYKERVYSPNRILYPYEARGLGSGRASATRKTVASCEVRANQLGRGHRIIVAKEVLRIKETYGLNSILGTVGRAPSYQDDTTAHAARRATCSTRWRSRKLALSWSTTSGCTKTSKEPSADRARQGRRLHHAGDDNPDSLGRLVLGRQAHLGPGPGGRGRPVQPVPRCGEQHAIRCLFWGCDVETTPWGWGGCFPSRYCFFLTRHRRQADLYLPRCRTTALLAMPTNGYPCCPNTDSALAACHSIRVDSRGPLRPRNTCETHAIGFDWFVYHVNGGDDGIAKTPEWAEGVCGVPARTIKALARHWAKHNVSIAHCNGGLDDPLDLQSRAGSPGSRPSGHAGAWASRAQPGEDDGVAAVRLDEPDARTALGDNPHAGRHPVALCGRPARIVRSRNACPRGACGRL